MTASLIQALFSEVKDTLRKDVNLATQNLAELGGKAGMGVDLLSDLMVEHMNERIAMFIICTCTLLVCSVSVWCSIKSYQAQERLRQEVLDRIDEALSQGSVKRVDPGKVVEKSSGRITLRRDRQSLPPVTTLGYTPVPSFLDNGPPAPSTSSAVALV